MHPRVTKITCLFGLLLTFVLASLPLAASDELGGEVRLLVERESAGWVGQEVELYLELWSDGLSFGDQLFQPRGEGIEGRGGQECDLVSSHKSQFTQHRTEGESGIRGTGRGERGRL